jgi:transcriptional regulator with GAF, ATPase, and Fis domain
VLTISITEEEGVPNAETRTLAEAERDLILKALEKAGWHIKGRKGAAAQLGLNPGTLYSRMKKLGISTTRQQSARSPG